MSRSSIFDDFARGPASHWIRLAVGHADVEWEPGRLRFAVHDAPDDQLADAEIGDYRNRLRKDLPWRPPLRLAVRARFSHPVEAQSGTSGFGFWNNPFALPSGDLLAPPNALWFFCASVRSDMVTAPGLPGSGLRAEMIHGGKMPRWLMRFANRLLQVPGLTSILYRAAQTQVNADAVRLNGLKITDWHDYVLFWSRSEVVFSVDEREILRTPDPPSMPLGFVAWCDNQVAVARPDGEFRFGLERVPGNQWLELECVKIEML